MQTVWCELNILEYMYFRICLCLSEHYWQCNMFPHCGAHCLILTFVKYTINVTASCVLRWVPIVLFPLYFCRFIRTNRLTHSCVSISLRLAEERSCVARVSLTDIPSRVRCRPRTHKVPNPFGVGVGVGGGLLADHRQC